MKTANDELKFVVENSSFFNHIIVHKELEETIPFLYRSVLATELEQHKLLKANK
jgi:hypothetical protein